ncbi:MAG TPA: phosphopantothenoylcysteine decarboxylase [Opitutales bacterium]|nr:phosphopantothenoylcysteine decarboxylase [Opitutales bacterium]
MHPIRCLVTAGPTREFFDPVRFISNPSSGRMGFALAEAAAKAGWEVTLVAGPVALAAPEGVEREDVVSAEDMFRAVDSRFDACDILIMSAAVSDYRPREIQPQKVKKSKLEMTIEMEPTRDILKTVAARKTPAQYVVGFAAETGDVVSYALGKMLAKNCDLMVANRVGGPVGGFMSDDNIVTLLGRDGFREEIGPAPKTFIAGKIVCAISAALSLRA